MYMRSRFELAVVLVLVLGAVCVGIDVDEAQALPPGRHYEMVSPVFKGGFGATEIEAVSPNGESVGYYSAGVFEGAPSTVLEKADYLATRGASKWSTVPVTVPASLLIPPFVDFSPSLSVEFAAGTPGPNVDVLATETLSMWLHPTDLPDTDPEWLEVGKLEAEGKTPGLAEYYASDPDFCHLLFLAPGTALVPEAEGTFGQLYEIDRGCDGEPSSVALVGVNNKDRIINRECGVDVGEEDYSPYGLNKYNAISEDGSEVFFTDSECPHGDKTESSTPHQLFVRLGGTRTLEISRPLEAGAFGGCVGESGGAPGEVPCAGAALRSSADFAGASKDGSTVYFTTGAPLASGDDDAGDDLYVARIGCPSGGSGCQAGEREITSLTQASHDPNGGAADVLGIVRVAPDGQRAYFVANGDLLTSSQQQVLESEGRPVPRAGADNLYVYDDTGTGTISFIADLCSGTEKSGAVEDFRCPGGNADTALWTSGGETAGESQTAGPHGEFLVFSTYAQLTSDDANTVKDVYRYDAETGVILRVSIGEDGYDPNGGGGQYGANIEQGHRGGTLVEQYEMDNRAISEDGSRIVFTSREPFSPSVTNGLVNAYEWHEGSGPGEGSDALVSTGSDQEPVDLVVISPDGSSVFFDTVQGLVPQDTDGAPDVYVARFGGGFPPNEASPEPCEGDGCQGPLTNPAPLLVPGSISQAPGGNLPPPVVAVSKAKAKPKCKRGYVRGKQGKCAKVKRTARKAHKTAVAHGSSRSLNVGGLS